MWKKTGIILIFYLTFLPLIAFANSYMFSETKHTAWLQSSADYALADRLLNTLWKKLRTQFSKEEYTRILNEQKDWLEEGRNQRANFYFPEFSEAEAFTQATFDRILQLDNLIAITNTELKYNYEKTGAIEIILGGDMAQLTIHTVSTTNDSCNGTLYAPYPLQAGWNMFETDTLNPLKIGVFISNNYIAISQTYLTGNAKFLASNELCQGKAHFEGIYTLQP